MKLQLKRMVFIGIFLMFLFSIGFAEVTYVPVGRVLTLCSGPSTEYKILAMVESGQQAKILESTEKWSRVRLSNGKEGYLLTKYLITEERWRQTIEAKHKKQEERAEEKKRKAEVERKNQESKQMANLKPSGTKFKITYCKKSNFQKNVFRKVIGYVPPEIDISDDLMAKRILREAAFYALTQKECPNPYPGGENHAIIFLYICDRIRRPF